MLGALAGEPASPDQLATRTGLTPEGVAMAVAALERTPMGPSATAAGSGRADGAAIGALWLARAAWRCRYGGSVGFNPYRTRRQRKTDIAIVVAAFVIVAVLLGWAFFAVT